jgi:hypothetical protein
MRIVVLLPIVLLSDVEWQQQHLLECCMALGLPPVGLVSDLTRVRAGHQAAAGEDVEFTPDLLKNEARPELVKFLSDTYSRMAEGEVRTQAVHCRNHV